MAGGKSAEFSPLTLMYPEAESRPPDRHQEGFMNIDRAVFIIAGSLIILSVVLGWYLSPYWFLLTLFVGANMFQAAFTGFCPAAIILRKLGLKFGPAFDNPTR